MVDIRRANLNDLDALVQLRLDLLREVGDLKNDAQTTALADATRQYLIRKMPTGEFVCWVASVDGCIVGTSGLVLFERPPVAGNLLGMEAYVMNIYTIPEWRSKGVATALIEEIVSFAKSADARRIWLHASKDGKRIYEKVAFVSTTSEMQLVW